MITLAAATPMTDAEFDSSVRVHYPLVLAYFRARLRDRELALDLA